MPRVQNVLGAALLIVPNYYKMFSLSYRVLVEAR